MIDKEVWIKEAIQKTVSRINDISAAMDTANDSLVNDTKSSMGDKYETSREMAQQELSRLQQQWKQAQQDLDTLQHLPLEPLKLVGLGSLVVTNQFNYLLSISIGPMKIDQETVMVISKESPIGKLLIGKKIGDTLTFNGKEIKIMNLL